STEASTTLTTARRSSRRRPAGPSPPPYDPGRTQPNQRGVFHRILRRAGQTDALSQLGGASTRLPQCVQRGRTSNDHAGHVGGSPRRGVVQGEGGGDLGSCAGELGQPARHDRVEGAFGGHPPPPNRQDQRLPVFGLEGHRAGTGCAQRSADLRRRPQVDATSGGERREVVSHTRPPSNTYTTGVR